MAIEEPHNSVADVPAQAVKLIGPFIKRGKELLDIQPLISYYCYLYAAQLILESQLHLEYAEIANYIEILLNTIEENRKIIENSAPKFQEILTDKEKSFKLVLGFSLSIFNKCTSEIDNHISSKKTVQNFMAFLNFIEVIKLWPEFYTLKSDEIQKQIKFAKFHMNRILRAIKDNTDPNDYITEKDEKELDELIEDSSSQNKNIEEPEQKQGKEEEHEQQLNEENRIDKEPDYFSLPETPSEFPGELNLPSAPVLIKGQKNSLGLPSAPVSSNSSEESIVNSQPVNSIQEQHQPPTIPQLPPKPVIHKTQVSKHVPQPVKESNILTKEDIEKIWSKEEIIANAQRKAKFAISALNYEDIETAINELQEALKLLKGE
jgi:vacuolar protein sorting-associated protein VTA1